MKRKMVKSLAAILCTTSVFTFTGCSGSESADTKSVESSSSGEEKKQNTQEVSLKIGEAYYFKDIPEGTDVSSWKFSSKDNSIAEVREGKYIIAHKPGETTITVDNGSETNSYNVDVKEDSNRLLKTVDVKDMTVYLGAGYNALNSNEYISLNQLNLSKSIITPTSLKQYRKEWLAQKQEEDDYDEGDDIILSDSSSYDKYLKSEGSSTNSYIDNLQTNINGEFNIDIKGIVGAGVKGKFDSLDNKSSKNEKVYSSVIILNQKYKYFLNVQTKDLMQMAKQNKAAWNKLIDKNVSPKDLFELYGTHIVTEALIGGRIELDYVMTAKNSESKQSEILDISGELNLNLSALKADASGRYLSSKTKSALDNDVSIKTSIKTYGGKSTSATLMTDIESYIKGYKQWYETLDDSHITFIGSTGSGLFPIWELLEDDEYKERRNELRNYYENAIKNEQK